MPESGTAAVDAFVDALAAPRRDEVEALRWIVLGVDPEIGEGIKWNAPSFHTSEHFATMNLRAADGVTMVLHLGAKVRTPPPAVRVDDPLGMLEWKSPDRATVHFADLDTIRIRQGAFAQILRGWMTYL